MKVRNAGANRPHFLVVPRIGPEGTAQAVGRMQGTPVKEGIGRASDGSQVRLPETIREPWVPSFL